MAKKVFLLIFASFLFVQTAFAEDKAELTKSVTGFYIQMLDHINAAMLKNYESIFNDVENNANTIDRAYALKVAELKIALEKPKTSAASMDALKDLKNDYFVQIRSILTDTNKIARETPKLSEQNMKLQQAMEKTGSDAIKIMEEYTNQTVETLERFWKSLTPAEQQAEQKLGEVFNEIKNETLASKKFNLIEKEFQLSGVISRYTFTQ